MKGLTGTKRKLLLIELFAVLRCIEIHKKSSTEVSNAFRFKATDDAFWIDDYDMAKIVVLTFVIDVVDSVIYFVMKLLAFRGLLYILAEPFLPLPGAALIMYELGRHDLMYDLFVPLYHTALLIYLPRRMFASRSH